MLILLLATAAATRHTAFSLHHSRAPPKREDLYIIIGDSKVNVTAYASEHPGGAEILRRFNGKNATRAFEATSHSPQAYELLRELSDGSAVNGRGAPTIKKLFTLEDRSNSHKLLGIFCLAHFVWRYWLVLFTNDSTASFANAGAFGMAALAAHTALSLSSFKFDVPKERVKRKPMIWQEYRAHNSIFATRSFA